MAKKNDDHKLEQLRQEFTDIVEELRKEVETLRKELSDARLQIRQVSREASMAQKQSYVVWEKTSGTLGDLGKKIADIAKPLHGYRKDDEK